MAARFDTNVGGKGERPVTRAEAATRNRHDDAAAARAVAELTAAFGNRVVASAAVRAQHANTTTWIVNEPPDAVVFPQSAADVQAIVRTCAAHRVPVIPFGA